jgi:hypothetical protein
MLTDKQREIFSRVLDLNWDAKREVNPTKKLELVQELTRAKDELKSDMGQEAYDKFMTMGQKMFN